MNTSSIPRRRAHWACACALAAGLAHATPPESGAAVAAPPPFDTYQAWRDQPVADWHEANERVRAVGGWRTYLRESQDEAAGDDAPAQHHHH